MLGEDVAFELDWVSIYTFQCRRMARFRHGRTLFAGDSAHQVSPFGARGANSGVQDVDDLVWRLKLLIEGKAPDSILDGYDRERVQAADENILNSTRSTDFITPKSEASRTFRDAVLDLSARCPFARPLVNAGRLSLPTVYGGASVDAPDAPSLPARTRPGAPASDAPLDEGWLLSKLGGRFVLLAIDRGAATSDEPAGEIAAAAPLERVSISADDDPSGALAERYLGEGGKALYLIRPDQHVAARWLEADDDAVRAALAAAIGGTRQGGKAWRA
jgi:3-(3-hydroxy-phenyl)propionate hydroxylase